MSESVLIYVRIKDKYLKNKYLRIKKLDFFIHYLNIFIYRIIRRIILCREII